MKKSNNLFNEEYAETKKNKFKLSKRGKLYLVNGIFLAFILLLVFWETVMFKHRFMTEVFLKYTIIQCIFTFFSFIIYYVSIITDAICSKYNYTKNDEKQ